MSRIVEVAPDVQQEVSEYQRLELENLRKLNIVRVFSSQARDDEEHEQSWLQFLNPFEDETLYVAEPGVK